MGSEARPFLLKVQHFFRGAEGTDMKAAAYYGHRDHIFPD